MVYHKFNIKNIKGFSLVELVIVLGIFSLFMLVSDSLYVHFKNVNNLNTATNATVEALRYASSNASSGKDGSKWGVKINQSEISIFKGDSYAARDTSFKETTSIPSGVSASGLSEVVFEKISGSTLTTGTAIFTNGKETKNININAKGTITY